MNVDTRVLIILFFILLVYNHFDVSREPKSLCINNMKKYTPVSTTINGTYTAGQSLNVLCVCICLVAVIATRIRYYGRPIVVPTVGKREACLLRDDLKVRINS